MKTRIIAIIFSVISFTLSGQSLDISGQNDNQEENQEQSVDKQVTVGSDKASVKKNIRNYIKDGNALYREKRYSEAEVKYRKALELDPNSEYAQYNLASTLLKTAGNTNPSDGENKTEKDAVQILENLTKTGQVDNIVEKAYYNLGNLAYNKEQYAQSIELYKNTLRRNPNNDKARENLRLAQLKLQQQQQNKNNQDQDKDQDKKDQQQKQDQQQQQQQQNKDQEQQQQQKQQQQSSMSDANAEKILKAMENEEAKTRRRVEAQKAKEQNTQRRNIEKPW